MIFCIILTTHELTGYLDFSAIVSRQNSFLKARSVYTAIILTVLAVLIRLTLKTNKIFCLTVVVRWYSIYTVTQDYQPDKMHH